MGEPGRTNPYQEDLRWRIVWQRIGDCFSIRQISENLHVAQSTILRILDRFERTGSVCHNQATPRPHTLHLHDEYLLVQLLTENPGMYLSEMKRKLNEVTGVITTESTICRTLKRLGFTRKKLQNVALQRCSVLIAEYQSEVSMYDSSLFIFLDKTGSDCKDALRRYGYSMRGYPARSAKLLIKGKRYSAIGIMSTTALLDCYIVEGTSDGDVFYNFVQSSLLPQLLPFNGQNPNSIVIMATSCGLAYVNYITLISSGFLQFSICLKLPSELQRAVPQMCE